MAWHASVSLEITVLFRQLSSTPDPFTYAAHHAMLGERENARRRFGGPRRPTVKRGKQEFNPRRKYRDPHRRWRHLANRLREDVIARPTDVAMLARKAEAAGVPRPMIQAALTCAGVRG